MRSLSLAEESVELAVFPELCLTGYSCGDLFRQPSLFDAAFDGLAAVAATTAATGVTVVVGLPFVHRGRCYNAAAVVASGMVVGIVPKQHLPNRSEFYEDRWFVRATGREPTTVRVGDAEVPFGTDLLFALPGRAGAVVAIEICEDLWAVEPPSGPLALAGANIIANPSASPELLGKAEYRTRARSPTVGPCHRRVLLRRRRAGREHHGRRLRRSFPHLRERDRTQLDPPIRIHDAACHHRRRRPAARARAAEQLELRR